MSLTSTLLKDKRRGRDLFFLTKNKYNPLIEPSKRNDPKARFARVRTYSLSGLRQIDDFNDFYKTNESNIVKFRELFSDEQGNFEDYDLEQTGKLLWYYRKLQAEYLSEHPSREFIVHFIRPSFIEVGYNILLSLATNKKLKPDQLSFIYLILYRIISQTTIEKSSEVKRHATRAAISQAMARNASHNSNHVMNRLTDGRFLEELKFTDLVNYNSSITFLEKSIKPEEVSERKLEEVPERKIFHQLAFYINYMKCRMDYLSDITFGKPVMQTNKKVFGELFREFDKVRLLLEYISGLDKFKYEIKFTRTVSRNAPLDITDDNDFSVAMPNDILGSQAFYNILENIIRNTAKHNHNKAKDEKTVFTVDFKDVSCSTIDHSDPEKISKQISSFYQVEVSDNIPITGDQKKLTKEDKNAYKNYSGEDVDKLSPIEWLVASQNIKLNESVLDEKTNKLRTTSLGLLEMEASSAYLRKLDVNDIEANENTIKSHTGIHNANEDLTILKAFNKDGCLGYRFFVSKPTEFLFIGDFDIAQSEVEQLNKEGTWLKSKSEFESELKGGEVFNHQFMIYEDASIKKICDEHPTSLPIRLLKVKKLPNLKTSSAEIEKWVWQNWFNEIKPKTVTNINVFTSLQQSHKTRGSFNIALSNHNETWEANKKDFSEIWKDDKKDFSNNSNYLEPLSTNAQKKLPNFRTSLPQYLHDHNDVLKRGNGEKPEKIPELIKQKLFEMAINKVLVIDERIQRFSKTDYEADGIKVSNQEIFNCSGVIIPEDIALGTNNYSPEVVKDIEKYVNDNVANCKFLLIHYSILERMYKNTISTINKNLQQWSERTNIIITSGRGNIPDLPKNKVRFVHLSPVLNAFIENRSKYAINYLLNSARM